MAELNSDKEKIDPERAECKKILEPYESANAYSTKKTVMQGLLDLALLTRNTKILRDYIVGHTGTGVHTVVIVLCCLAILVQIASAFMFMVIGRWNWDVELNRAKLHRLNNATMVLVLLSIILDGMLTVFDQREPLDKKTG